MRQVKHLQIYRMNRPRPPMQVLRALVDQYRDQFGVEPICKVLRIAPSGYRRHAAEARNPSQRCPRRQRDDALMP